MRAPAWISRVIDSRRPPVATSTRSFGRTSASGRASRTCAAAASASSCSTSARSAREVLDREEAGQRLVDAVGAVDQAARDALAQRTGAEVDEPDLVGLVQDAVGERLAHLDAGQRLHALPQALDVLDVDRRPDVDAPVEQPLDVLVALGARRAGGVGVGELVDQRDGRAALEQPLEVGLGLGPAALAGTRSSARARGRARAPRSGRGRAARGSRRRGRRRPRPRAARRPASCRSCRRRPPRRGRCAAGRGRRREGRTRRHSRPRWRADPAPRGIFTPSYRPAGRMRLHGVHAAAAGLASMADVLWLLLALRAVRPPRPLRVGGGAAVSTSDVDRAGRRGRALRLLPGRDGASRSGSDADRPLPRGLRRRCCSSPRGSSPPTCSASTPGSPAPVGRGRSAPWSASSTACMRIDPAREMRWTEYARGVLLFSGVQFLVPLRCCSASRARCR